jgi:dienelactone hydrolase
MWIWGGVAMVAAAALAGLGIVRYAFALPPPAGAFPVGTIAMELDRPLEPGESDPGTFNVQIWYPGEPSRDRAPYGTGAGSLKHRVYHALVRTNAGRDVGVATSAQRFPVLVYVSAWGSEGTENTSLLEDLASHGFVVAAFGDIHYDDPPLERLDGAADFSSEAAYHQTLRVADERLEYLARRASTVLDHLAALDARDSEGRFTGRLDINRAGILGYSFGGAVAFKTCQTDSRFKAAMNMDGWLFGASSGYRGGVPYFVVSDRGTKPGPDYVTDPDPEIRYASQLTVVDIKRQQEVLRHGGYELVIDGADHLSFSDVPLFAPKHRFSTGQFNPRGVARSVHAYADAFFEQTLEGTPSPLLVPGEKVQPAMTLASWPVRR